MIIYDRPATELSQTKQGQPCFYSVQPLKQLSPQDLLCTHVLHVVIMFGNQPDSRLAFRSFKFPDRKPCIQASVSPWGTLHDCELAGSFDPSLSLMLPLCSSIGRSSRPAGWPALRRTPDGRAYRIRKSDLDTWWAKRSPGHPDRRTNRIGDEDSH